jgi:phage-related protein
VSTIPPIQVKIEADTTGLKQGLTQAEQGIKNVNDSVKTASTGMQNFTAQLKKVGAAMGLAFAGAQIAQFGKDVILASSNMAETVSKVNVVFGDTADAVHKFGETAATAMGISSQQALEAAGTYGNLFQALGVGKEKSQEMSVSMVQLASDLASFNNMSVTDSLNALRSGLSGETEPLKRFGIALNDVTLKNKAMAMGFGEIKGVMDPAIKAQVTYALVMEQTTLAQGDYARTADGTANTMKTLQARFQDAKVALGDALMPAFKAVLSVLNLLIPVLTAIGKYFKENADAIKMYAIIVGTLVAAFYTYRAALVAVKVAQQLYVVWTTLMKGATLASIASTNGLAASMLVLNAVMYANPIPLVIAAIVALGVAFVYAWKKSETFRGIVIKVVQGIMKYVEFMITMWAKFFGLLGKIPGMGWAKKIGEGLDGISTKIKTASKNLNDLKSNFKGMGNVSMTTGTAGVTGGVTTNTPSGTTTNNSAAENKKKITEYLKDVKKIYKEMDEVIAEAREKAAEALAARDEKIAEARERAAEAEADLRKRFNERMAEAQKRHDEAVADAHKRYNETVADANKRFREIEFDANKDYAEKTIELTENLNEKLADLKASAAKKSLDLTKSAAEKQDNLLKQSIDRLRSAFASKTGFSLAESFKEGGTSDSLLKDLKNKLQAAKDLQANAAALAGMGYSQVFIEEVVKNGPEAGNKIAEALKAASPEATRELQQLYGQVDQISEHGLDDLAKTMNAGANLATQELKDAYSQVAIDLKESLATVDLELQTSLAEANEKYAKSMVEAKKVRDEKIAEAAKQLSEALAEAKKNLDESIAEAAKALAEAQAEAQKDLKEGLAEIQKDLQKALAEAQKDYEKAIDEINKSTTKKLADLKAKLAEIAALMKALGASTSGIVSGAPKYTPIVPSVAPITTSPTTTSPSSAVTVNNNIVATNVDPYDVHLATLSAIKYGAAVTPKSVNTTTLAGIMAASVNQPTGAQVIASRRQAFGEI